MHIQTAARNQLAIYGDNEPFVCKWLNLLIEHKHIHSGVVSDKSISDMTKEDIDEFKRVHLFAGIGGWDYALKLAGWPDDRPVWTGSCPCQPFSCAGKGEGVNDKRHLWPEMRRLVAERLPPTIFGEQVASKAGRGWLSSVRADLEALGYAVGAADLCGASIGAPHIRQRLFWVANRDCRGLQERLQCNSNKIKQGLEASCGDDIDGCSKASRVANCCSSRLEEWQEQSSRKELAAPERSCDASWMVHSTDRRQARKESRERPGGSSDAYRLGHTNSSFSKQRNGSIQEHLHTSPAPSWSDVEFAPCRDGKARPVKSGVRLLAHGIPGRVGQLRGFGNAIIPQVAALFIRSFMEAEQCK